MFKYFLVLLMIVPLFGLPGMLIHIRGLVCYLGCSV